MPAILRHSFEGLYGHAQTQLLTDYAKSRNTGHTGRLHIYHAKYSINGDSKARRMRAFWELADDQTVGKVLLDLLDVWTYNHDPNGSDKGLYVRCQEIAKRLVGGLVPSTSNSPEEFLERKIDLPDLAKLNLDPAVTVILKTRLQEIEKGLKSETALSVIFLCGSILEGVLLGAALQKPKDFNQSACSPKDQSGKVKPFPDWSLAQLIDVACDIKLIKLDVKKFSHSLRDFRNYIHPYEQMASGFNPDKHTAEICFQVLKAALADMSSSR